MNLSETDKEVIAKIDERLKHYKLISEPDYLAQQKEVEKEWKVGEWAWLGKGKYVIGLITEINGIKATADDQNGFVVKGLNIDEFTQPTHEEIFNHLKGIAERKGFKEGVKFKYPQHPQIEVKTAKGEFNYIHDIYSELFEKDIQSLDMGDDTIWDSVDGWAEISDPKPEERWRPSTGEKYFYITDAIYVSFSFGRVRERIEAGNCFQTEEQAQSAATKIKEILLGL